MNKKTRVCERCGEIFMFRLGLGYSGQFCYTCIGHKIQKKTEEKQILEKIKRILESDSMIDSVKLANIFSILNDRYKYVTKPWWIV